MGLTRLKKFKLVQRMLEMFTEENELRVNDAIIEKARDSVTQAVQNTNSDHTQIHRGFGYCINLFHPSLAQNAKKIYRIKGPETLYAHIKSIQVSCAGATIKASLIKDVNVTVGGTEEECICNLNDNSDKVAESKVFDGDVEYEDGKTWCSVIVHGDTSGVGQNLGRSSGSFIQNDYIEYVTKNNNTDYILEIENIHPESESAVDIDVQIFMYEEPRGLIENDYNS